MRHRFGWLIWNRTERRLRAPWRLLAGTVLLTMVVIATLLVVQTIAAPFVTVLLAGFGSTTRSLLLTAVLGVIVALAVVAIAWTVDRRRPSDLGLRIGREWWAGCGVGLLVGATAMTAMFIFGVVVGWFGIESVSLSIDRLWLVTVLVAVFLVVGVYEELLIRGYLLTNLAEGLGWFEHVGPRSAAAVATLVSSLVFGGFHAMNPNATLVSTAIVSAAGVVFALGYLYTGELAIPIGIHITWNTFQGVVYGLPVSGTALPVSIVETSVRGPEPVSGGAFGPEAGLLGVAGIGLAALGTVVYCRVRTGRLAIDPTITTPELRNAPRSE